MKKRFRQLLGEIADKPMWKQKQILETTLDNWMQTESFPGKTEGYKQVDDILVMGIKTEGI